MARGRRVGIKWRDWAGSSAPLALALLAATGCTSTPDAGAEPTRASAKSGAPSQSVARVCAKPA
ncbi:right-handed parallel beta-helix repeat-containing protein, partial [Streptomyces sp. T-3]|nr:right-handed parallel beta-helix repeat-containing protein [Streptomyces sp. T-3]